MGFCQTTKHENGKGSFHQVGLVRGQFGAVPEEQWFDFVQKAGYDGIEEAGWELALGECTTPEAALKFAQKRLAKINNRRKLSVFTVAMHLGGQVNGDEPDARTLQFSGGEAVAAYKRWREAGNNPPKNDPLFVPEHVGQLMREQSSIALVQSANYAGALGKLQNRVVPIPFFTGSPARAWSAFFAFPPIPKEIAGFAITDPRDASLQLIVERFGSFFDACRNNGTKCGLECHPSERAMGDLASAEAFLKAMDDAGYGDVVGINFDGSHIKWQGCDPIQFIREFGNRIWSAHIKGVQVKANTRNGLLGGHMPMGHPENGWNFVTAGTNRDAVSIEEVIVELNRKGYDGAINVEWEDNDADMFAGAKTALRNIRRADLPPSKVAHDEALKAKS